MVIEQTATQLVRAKAGFTVSTTIARVALFACLLGVCALLQWRSGAFRSEFASYPDEPAHYVTGLMFTDYVREGLGSAPMGFAERYYIHYPKVALGHWPPMYYLAQTGWTLIFGTGRASVILLQAVLTALLALLISVRIRQYVGPLYAVTTGTLYCVLPTVQIAYSSVMTESIVALTTFISVLFFISYLERRKAHDILFAGAFTFITIMTKGDGWAIPLVFAVVFLLRREWWMLRQRSVWGAALIVAAAVPWYVMTLRMAENGLVPSSVTSDLWRLCVLLVREAGPLLVLLAAAGSYRMVFRQRDTFWTVLLVLVVVWIVFHGLAPTGQEPRRIHAILSSVVAFAAAGAWWLMRARSVGAAALLLVTLPFLTFPVKANHGYGVLADDILSRNPVSHLPVLIVCNSICEGGLVSETALREPSPRVFLLRGSKLLARMQWSGRDYELVVHTPQQAFNILDSIPVGTIIVTDAPVQEHEKLVRALLTQRADAWKLTRRTAGLSMYRRVGAEHWKMRHVEVDLTRMLGRTITHEIE